MTPIQNRRQRTEDREQKTEEGRVMMDVGQRLAGTSFDPAQACREQGQGDGPVVPVNGCRCGYISFWVNILGVRCKYVIISLNYKHS